ncbi:MAG: hypothetical protein ACI9C9_000643 [Marivirga sp.]|jgi:hypothetical protein
MLNLILTIIDFGLLILAWLVQAIIYPSFQYIDRQKLVSWHNRYQRSISYFVLPLMLLQIAISFLLMIDNWKFLNIIHFTLILIIWLSTFLQAVPLHGRIANQEELNVTIPKLVKVNLLRTLLWTATFMISLLLLLENIKFLSA